MILKFSEELEELVGRKWQMAPNRMFQQLTDKTKKRKKHKKFSNIFKRRRQRIASIFPSHPPSLPPSLTGFIQASVTKIVTSESRETPNENRLGPHYVMW